MTPRTTRHLHYGWQIAIAIILVLVVLSFSIPAVRAAISAWLGLSVAPSNQMPATSVTLVAVTPSKPTGTPSPAAPPTTPARETTATTEPATPTPVPTEVTSFVPAEISGLSSQAGWNILVPGSLPDGYQFQSAYLDTNHQMVILTYLVTRPLPDTTDPSLTASKTITLLQAQKNDFVPMQIAPDAQVTDIQVNGQPAVYVIGAWDTEFVPDSNDPNGGQMVSTWRNNLPLKNLYWQVGNIYLAIMTDDDAVSQQELIDMAASIGK